MGVAYLKQMIGFRAHTEHLTECTTTEREGGGEREGERGERER